MADSTTVSDVITFHGITLLVIEHESIRYIYAKPLVDLAGVDWRGAKKALQSGDNVTLFGTTKLPAPILAAEGGDISPRKESLFIRLDRAHMYLARIDTKRMRTHGNVEAAEALLELQVEWAQALHEYETKGAAVKHRVQDDLFKALKARDGCQEPAQRKALSKMVNDLLRDVGYPVQEDFIDGEQA